MAWIAIFFFASPAASAACLTVSETFPLEVHALAIALFYAVGTGIGGVAAAALIAWRLGVNAERKPLEEAARPLAARE